MWEVAVKSFKFYLKKVDGDSTLTFEVFHTLTCQIEALLNSRFLCSIRSDLNGLVALTPGHFFVCSSLTMVLEPYDFDSKINLKMSRISRRRLIKDIRLILETFAEGSSTATSATKQVALTHPELTNWQHGHYQRRSIFTFKMTIGSSDCFPYQQKRCLGLVR